MLLFLIVCFQVTHLFDNGGTVFFAIFMAIWGRFPLLVCFSELAEASVEFASV